MSRSEISLSETSQNSSDMDRSQDTGTRAPSATPRRVDHKHALKKEVMDQLALIEERLDHSLLTWELKSGLSKKKGAPAAGDFPRGFGFFLMNGRIEPQNMGPESELGKVHDTILALPGEHLKDQLLCFFDDYLLQQEVLHRLRCERSDVLTEVSDWLQDQGAELTKCESTHLGVAMEAEGTLQKSYMNTLENIEKLYAIKAKITEACQKPRRSDALGSFSAPSAEQVSPETTGELSDSNAKPGSSMAAILKILQKARNDKNGSEIDAMESKIWQVSSKMETRKADLKKVRQQVKMTKEELSSCQEKSDSSKEEVRKLKAELEALEQSFKQKKKPPKDSDAKNDAAGKKPTVQKLTTRSTDWFFEDKATQTNEDKRERRVKKRHTSKVKLVPPDQKAEQRTDQKAEQRTGQKAGQKADKLPEPLQESASTSRRADRATRKAAKAVRIDERNKSAFSKIIQEGALSAARGRTLTSYVEAKAAREKEAVEDSIMDLLTFPPREMSMMEYYSLFEEARDKRFAEKRRVGKKAVRTLKDIPELVDVRKSELDLPKNVISPDDVGNLHSITKNFIDGSVKHAQEMFHELMALRRNARKEVKRVVEKEKVLMEVEHVLAFLQAHLDAQQASLPVVKRSWEDETLAVSNRKQDDHHCRFCVCRETTAETTQLSQDQPSEEELTFAHSFDQTQDGVDGCQRYIKSLEDVKCAYCDSDRLIKDAQAEVKRILTHMQVAKLNGDDYSDLNQDVEASIEIAVNEALDVPDDVEQLTDHANFISHTINSLTIEIVGVVQHTYKRLADLRARNKALDQLEETLYRARSLLDKTALSVARTRSKERFLHTGAVLKGCVCPYCQCYNSPFDDGTRAISRSKKRDVQRHVLVRSVSQLQQMMGLVLRSAPADNPLARPLISAVDPAVLDMMENAQKNLYRALDVIEEDEEEEEEEV